MTEPYQAFWGKASPDANACTASHPLVAHALDVAAVAVLLPPRWGEFLDGRLLGFLVSLHDIGKFSRPFQALAPLHWPTAALGPANTPPPGPKHDVLTATLLQHVVGAELDQVLPIRQGNRHGWMPSERARLFRALAGHHGRPVDVPVVDARVLDAGCKAAASAFVTAMLDVFRPDPCFASDFDLTGLEWRLAGLTTLADWVGSRQAWFPYADRASTADPGRYFWTHALPRAAAALSAAGLAAAPPAPFKGIGQLFPGITTPSPVQRWAEQVTLPDGPVLAVIEDLTGSGKTEAALTLCHRLLASGRATGIFMALPTMATANAMFDRMADAYRRLFTNDSHPSLALVHGRAELDSRFAPAFCGGWPRPEQASDPADIPAEAHCAAWLAEDRRRALLAQVGVGTIDQALLAVLPVRHATLRLQGLGGKVLIVDEAHAFDPYMRRELVELLRFHAALGGSAILLSATLLHTTRTALVNAYRNAPVTAGVSLNERAYPLATLTGITGAVVEQPCAVRDRLPRSVTVTRLPDANAAILCIKAAAATGAAIAWIRNTVDDALNAAAALRAQGIEPLVFHARFALCDRLVIEKEVLRRFGRDSAGLERKCVLIATQVVEQSLDLDFDLLCTDLAPVDRLIQRAGRLWRHDRPASCRPLGAPELLVVSPEPVDDPAPGWIKDVLPGTAAVYADPALLWRSARALFSRRMMTTPADMRPLIEAAGDADSPGNVPPGLAAAAARAEGRDAAAFGIAAQNVLSFKAGYTPGGGAWDPDTATPTRLAERPQVTLRLARLHDGRIVPYANLEDDLRRAWALSEITVARYRVASCPIPRGFEAAAILARAGWGRWERESEHMVLALLGLTETAGSFTLAARAEDDRLFTACYTLQEGLRWSA